MSYVTESWRLQSKALSIEHNEDGLKAERSRRERISRREEAHVFPRTGYEVGAAAYLERQSGQDQERASSGCYSTLGLRSSIYG